ncbi:MAG: replication-associated recombination protein A [Acidimicrobiia bacterium]|nr:replication-associated recombination protein A [Acidimicrobiia bacterium]
MGAGRRVTSDDLWAEERAARRTSAQPLAARMRPRSLDEVVGQRHLLEAGAAFRSVVESERPLSMILWGPPGTGKTTLARLIASFGHAEFVQLSATSAGVKDVREVLATARERLGRDGSRTVLFIDEIHRFNKSQQDALLPGVEDGTVILVGATTENPFFEVNSPLMSRASLFRTEKLTPDDIGELVDRAVTDPRGIKATIDDEARSVLTERVGGDARLALNALEMAGTVAAGSGRDVVILSDVEEALQRRIVRYDKAGDRHYDVISAFIKSVRGSDVDAALYWLHTMIEAGEDAQFIARRMIILASEDIGLADPQALVQAVAAFDALRVIGLPEARYALTQAAVYLAMAPKSNSITRAIRSAREAVVDGPATDVPMHLRSASTKGERMLGHGKGYRYPHDAPGGWVDQQYLPDGIRGGFYEPGDQGDEPDLVEGKPGGEVPSP